MAKAMDVADYIITKTNDLNSFVSNLQLQKVMYFIDTMYLLDNYVPLITDLKFVRWNYGPTQVNVYKEYAVNGGRSIKEVSKHYTYENGLIGLRCFREDNIDEKARNYIDKKLKGLISIDTFELVDESHKEPQWQSKYTNEEYDDNSRYKYYSELINSHNNPDWLTRKMCDAFP